MGEYLPFECDMVLHSVPTFVWCKNNNFFFQIRHKKAHTLKLFIYSRIWQISYQFFFFSKMCSTVRIPKKKHTNITQPTTWQGSHMSKDKIHKYLKENILQEIFRAVIFLRQNRLITLINLIR